MDCESSEGLIVENRIYNMDIGGIISSLSRQTKVQRKERQVALKAWTDAKS
jgi:hypothetical protein